MEIKLNPKWKWVAMDSDGDIFFYTHKPERMDDGWIRKSGGFIFAGSLLEIDLGENWKESLHEILPDGTLKKHIERPDLKVDDKILVRYSGGKEWFPRHFSHWDSDGYIVCFCDGLTSWSANGTLCWKVYKLPEEEQS